MTLKQVALIPATADDIPEEIRLTGSSCAAIRAATEILWKSERSTDRFILDDLRGDDSFFWFQKKPSRITSPYGPMNLNLICLCENILELSSLDYVKFPPKDLVDQRGMNPADGCALVRMIASAAAGDELVTDRVNVTVYKAYNGRRSLPQITGNKAVGFVDVTVAQPMLTELSGETEILFVPASAQVELKSRRPVALFAADRDSQLRRPMYCVMAHDDSGQRIAGYQYNDNGTGLIFWFPRDAEACPARLTFTVIRQTIPTIQFRIALPERTTPESDGPGI